MRTARRLLPILITSALLGGLILLAGPRNLMETLRGARVGWLLLAVGIYPTTLILRWGRFLLLIRPEPVPRRGLLAVVAMHNGLNKVLPARSGELGFLYLAERQLGIRLSRGVSVLATARILDLTCVGLLFLGASTLGGIPTGQRGRLMTGIGLVGSVALLLGIGFLVLAGDRIAARLDRSTGGPWWRRVSEALARVAEGFGRISLGRALLPSLLLSILLWLLIYALFSAVLRGLGLDLPYPGVVWGATAAVLTNVIPIGAVGNFGPHEAGWTAGFMLVGLSREEAVASALVANLIFALAALICAALGWMFRGEMVPRPG